MARLGVDLDITLPEKPKRARQDDLIQIIKLLAITTVGLTIVTLFAVGGWALVGLVWRLVF
jgi:hypothetical protein